MCTSATTPALQARMWRTRRPACICIGNIQLEFQFGGGGHICAITHHQIWACFLLRQVDCGDKTAFWGRCHSISYIRSLHPISPEKQLGAITNDTSIYTDAGGPGRKNARKNAKVAKRQTLLQSISRFGVTLASTKKWIEGTERCRCAPR